MRMGAEIPRYSLEALQKVNSYFDRFGSGRSAVPFVLDDLPKAVHHAIICFLSSAFTRLKLSVQV